MSTLLDEIGKRDSNLDSVAAMLLRDPTPVPEVLAGLQSETARVKFGCAKVLRIVSEREPESLYPHFDVFVRLLDHKNKILQWEASFVLSHLARVDTDGKFDGVFARYFAPIPGPVMITAANVIGGAARIALAKPHWADRVAREVLKVGRAHYQTAECRNVAIGQAIETLGQIFGLLHDKSPAVRFSKRQLKNSRNATRKKAAQFLKNAGIT